jgi:hypothetical protein
LTTWNHEANIHGNQRPKIVSIDITENCSRGQDQQIFRERQPENYSDEYDHLLGNGSLVSSTTDNRPKHELFGVVAAIRSSRSYKREFIREFVREFRKQFSSSAVEC